MENTLAQADAAITRRRGPLRRRFILVAAGLLSILLAVLGINFAADSGTSTPAIQEKSGLAVTPSTPTAWNVTVGSAGSVPTASNLATINPAQAISGTKMLLSVYITNLADLAVNYSSWNFNLALYDSGTVFNDSTRVGYSATPPVSGIEVMTSDSGTLTWVVAIDIAKTYTLRLEAGGGFYTIGDGSSGSLSPAFFVRATEL